MHPAPLKSLCQCGAAAPAGVRGRVRHARERLRKVSPPTLPGLHAEKIAWVQPEEYVRILGIPFYEEYDENAFWLEKYAKMKRLVAAWRGHRYLTVSGANLLCNSMIMGRFRYYVQSMMMLEKFVAAIESDCQTLAWSATKEFDADELGTHESIRRYTGKVAQHGHRRLVWRRRGARRMSGARSTALSHL